jgi:hypothetical protein
MPANVTRQLLDSGVYFDLLAAGVQVTGPRRFRCGQGSSKVRSDGLPFRGTWPTPMQGAQNRFHSSGAGRQAGRQQRR